MSTLEISTREEFGKITKAQAEEYSSSKLEISGHQVYFVNLGSRFGYSALVFFNDRHISHLDQSAYLFGKKGISKTNEELRKLYTNKLKSELFTDEEILTPSMDYGIDRAKIQYLTTTYPIHFEGRELSSYRDWSEEDKEFAAAATKVGFYYFANESDAKDYKALLSAFGETLDASKQTLEYLKSAFRYQFWNCEYGYVRDDWDVIRRIAEEFKGVELEYASGKRYWSYLEAAGFGSEVVELYETARREYLQVDNFREYAYDHGLLDSLLEAGLPLEAVDHDYFDLYIDTTAEIEYPGGVEAACEAWFQRNEDEVGSWEGHLSDALSLQRFTDQITGNPSLSFAFMWDQEAYDKWAEYRNPEPTVSSDIEKPLVQESLSVDAKSQSKTR